MGIREVIDKNKSAVAAVTAVVVVGAGIYIATQARAVIGGPPGPGEVYYTTDEGKSLFTDSIGRIPPFDHNGKPAVRAYVFECGGKRTVGYLSRYSDEAVKSLQEVKAAPGQRPDPKRTTAIGSGIELKRPGEPNWVKQTDPAAGAIRTFKCPDGTTPAPVED